MKYEDLSWHLGDQFPADLPPEAAATHTGMFVAWAILAGLGGELHTAEFPEEIEKLRSRTVTPGRFFVEACDGKFTDEDLSDEGNAFATEFFDPETGAYMTDYDRLLTRGLPSQYHVPDTWASFDKLRPALDKRLANWRAGKGSGDQPWWRFGLF